MSITITEVKTKKQLKQFIKFPFSLYEGNQYWVPPLIADDLKTFNSKINPAYDFCESQLFLASRNGELCGRVAVIINHRYNEKVNKKMLRFGWIDFIDDYEVSKALIDIVEKIALERKMEFVEGPLGFTDFDPEGMLIEGFNELSTISGLYNHPYYKDHIEKLGYAKEVDWVEFEMFPPNPPLEKVKRISEISLQRYNLRFLKVKNKKELIPYVPQIFGVLNEAFSELHGFVSLTDKQIQYFTKQYFGFINPKFIPVVLDSEGKVAAFGITMPSLSRAFQKAKGKLFPFGFIHILKTLKKPELLDLLLIGIRGDMRDKGLNAILMNAINEVCNEYGITNVESNYELEDNLKVQNQWKIYERRQHKRRRSYRKYI